MSTSWPEKITFWLVHTHVSKCKSTPLEELIKQITEYTDCKLYCAYIILSICEDIRFAVWVEFFIMCQSSNKINDKVLFKLFILLIQGNLIRIFILV